MSDLVAWYQCGRKRRYDTWDEAIKGGHLSWVETDRNTPNAPMPYRCPHCGAYHVGHLSRLRQQERKAKRFFEERPRDIR